MGFFFSYNSSNMTENCSPNSVTSTTLFIKNVFCIYRQMSQFYFFPNNFRWNYFSNRVWSSNALNLKY